jgi:hypothetical protein
MTACLPDGDGSLNANLLKEGDHAATQEPIAVGFRANDPAAVGLRRGWPNYGQ